MVYYISIYIVKCAWDMYKVIIFVFGGIASGFTLVSIFPEDACMQVAGTLFVGIMRSFWALTQSQSHI